MFSVVVFLHVPTHRGRPLIFFFLSPLTSTCPMARAHIGKKKRERKASWVHPSTPLRGHRRSHAGALAGRAQQLAVHRARVHPRGPDLDMLVSAANNGERVAHAWLEAIPGVVLSVFPEPGAAWTRIRRWPSAKLART